jgi:hypothetical protein
MEVEMDVVAMAPFIGSERRGDTGPRRVITGWRWATFMPSISGEEVERGGGGDGAVQPFWERKRRGDSVAKCGTSAGVVRLEDEAAAAGACFCVRGRCSGRWADRGIWVCLLLREENERAD